MKKNGKRYTVLLGTLLTTLAICACGGGIGHGTGNGDTESGAETTSASRGMGKLLEDADFEADVTSWAAADGGRLLLNLPEGCYTYRTWYGRVGTGSLEHDDEDLVLIYGDLDGENDYYLLEDAGGLMPYHVNGESGGEWGELNERHFDPAAEELAPFDRQVLDGEWQNACGYSYVFDTTAMKVAESDPIGVMSSGDMYDREDGRGDLIPADSATIPVLMGGALPFTGMQTIRNDNYADGTYYYADITADGLTMLVNTVLAKDADAETDDLAQYLVDCARKLDETDIYELRSITQAPTLTEKFSYPVYIVEFTTGANEDTVKWTVFAMDTDQYTYLYGVCTDMDAAEDMDGIAQDIFGGLYLTDEAA